MPKGGKSGGGTKKYGRTKVKCALYHSRGRRTKNKEKHCLKSNGKSYNLVWRESRLANHLPLDRIPGEK